MEVDGSNDFEDFSFFGDCLGSILIFKGVLPTQTLHYDRGKSLNVNIHFDICIKFDPPPK